MEQPRWPKLGSPSSEVSSFSSSNSSCKDVGVGLPQLWVAWQHHGSNSVSAQSRKVRRVYLCRGKVSFWQPSNLNATRGGNLPRVHPCTTCVTSFARTMRRNGTRVNRRRRRRRGRNRRCRHCGWRSRRRLWGNVASARGKSTLICFHEVTTTTLELRLGHPVSCATRVPTPFDEVLAAALLGTMLEKPFNHVFIPLHGLFVRGGR